MHSWVHLYVMVAQIPSYINVQPGLLRALMKLGNIVTFDRLHVNLNVSNLFYVNTTPNTIPATRHQTC